MEYYAELKKQGIMVDDDNDPAPKNIPQTENTTTTAETAFNCNGVEGIVCPRLSSNLPDIPAFFNNYSHEDFMKI